MIQPDRILCLLDPRASAHPALQQALYLAERLGSTAYVAPAPVMQEAASSPAAAPAAGPLQATVEHVQEDTGTAGVPVAYPDADALPNSVDGLIAWVEDAEIDLLLMDTPEDRGPIPVLASDPVRALAERMPIPVFVVEHAPTPTSFRRLLVPIDFSEHSREALAVAKSLAALYDASLDVLHVMERPQYVALNPTDLLALSDATLPERKTRRRLQSFLAATPGPEVPARLHLLHGDAADQIGHFADEHAIDMVVLSTHGVIGRPQHALGTVADKVLRRVARPVFLARAFGTSLIPTPLSSSDGAPGGTPNLRGIG